MPSDLPTSLSAVHRRLLEQRLRERPSAPGGAGHAGTIARAPRDQPLPLSFGQERLWLLHHLEPGVAAYNSAYLYHLRGTLDVGALERALLEIVRRHESLRATIAVHEGDARQVIHEVAAWPLPTTAVPTIAAARHAARGTALAPFDLARDRPLRTHLFRIAAEEHVLLVAAHHSAWDAWSTQIFWQELSALYGSFRAGVPPSLAPIGLQYPDFAVWQRARLQGASLDRLLQYWRTELTDAPSLDLPSDRSRPAELTYAGDTLEFTWPAELRDALHTLARAEGATLFMALLASWSILLHRLSGQDTVVTGTAVAGRTRREFDSLIGFFVNTLALRTECGGNPTFRELIQRVRQTTLAAYDHDELPFEKLVADLRVPRDPARHPVFQTALVLHSAPPPAPALAGLEVESLPRVALSARFDLAMTLTETADGLRGSLEFSTALFDAATVARWLGHLETLLGAAITEPEARIDDLPWLTSGEREMMLGAWSGAPAPYPREATVHALFAEHAREAPAAIALVEGAAQLSYADLDARANRLAHHLVTTGAGRGSYIAIEVERSIDFVVSVLAVLKSGAAYVPLLRDLPAVRRWFILEDTRAVALISVGTPAGEIPSGTNSIDLTRDAAAITARPASAPNVRVAATDAAYVMYTSGSTGQPKGVVIPHRGIVRLVRGETPSRYGPGQRFLLLASTAFDASTFELWAPLLNGATLAIFPDRWPEFDPLARAVRDHGITHLFLTAGLFNQVVDHRPDLLAGVTHVFTGGEAMSARHAARVRELWPELRVTNCYGPTEITTYTASHELTRDEPWPGGHVPIGRPAPNARCYVLDPRGQPAPIGVPGELFLGGDGLALAYLNLPELTAERFVRDPFSAAPDGRMYRTGDRARWRPDGTLEFLGRLDEQVKIRGFRIEPGEIETTLTHHPDVQDAGVIAREDRPGELQLVGYVVMRADRALDPAAIRGFLAERLPDYMVPAAIIGLPHLPLTSNGKLDRRALPAPAAAATPAATRSIAPLTPTEALVAGIWRTVLGGAPADVHDNFFARGGHSLLAMQATAKLGAVLGRDVPLRWWFDHPTITTLAERVDRERSEAAIAPITLVPRTGELPLSHEEQRLWFLHHALPDPATYHVVWGWRVRGSLDLERLRNALGTVMARHEILRTGYANRAGRPVRVIAATVPVPLAIEEPARPAGAAGDLVLQHRLASEVRRPFTLERPPLWRVASLRLAPDDHLLVFTAHHLVCDEWSLPILHVELAAAFARAPDSMPALSVQYADYAVWQRQRVTTSAALQRAREFWREHLRGAPAFVPLPVGGPRRDVPTGAGRRVYFPLSSTAAAALEDLGRAEAATPFMTWLALYVALLARLTGQTDMVIGTPLARRDRAEVQSLIGFFLNTLPLRLRARRGASFRALLRHVREIVLDALAHGELPLDEIAAAHPGARPATGGALFNVMFVVRDDLRPVLALPGIRSEALDLGTGTAKADLTLFIERQPADAPRGAIEFNTEALTPAAVESLIWELQRIIEVVGANPEAVLLEPGAVEAPTAAPASSANASSSAISRPELEHELASLWRRVLRRENIGVHENFFALGGHSLLAMQLVHEIQQHFGRNVPLARLLAAPTIAGLARELAAEGTNTPATDTAWQGAGHGTPFFYVPGMNGVEFLPAAVAQRIAPDRRWFDGLQHPGVDGREPPAQSIEAIAAELVRQIRRAQPRGPYALGGFCHGGLVAYEVARQLEAQGQFVSALVLWDTFPYRRWRRRRLGEMLAVLRRRLGGPDARIFAADRWRFFCHRLNLAGQFLRRLVRARLPGARGRIAARMVSAGMHARRHYVPGRLRAPVLLVRSRDERVVVETIPQNGWAGAIAGSYEVTDLPHWHFHLLREPAVGVLAERTAEFLRKTDRR